MYKEVVRYYNIMHECPIYLLQYVRLRAARGEGSPARDDDVVAHRRPRARPTDRRNLNNNINSLISKV